MGSPLFDAVMASLRKGLAVKAAADRPAITAPPGLRSRGFDYAAQPVAETPGGELAEAWEAFLVHTDVNGSDSIEDLDMFRHSETLPSGRIVVCWLSVGGGTANMRLKFSDDGGETWSNGATFVDLLVTNALNTVILGGVLERAGVIDVYLRGQLSGIVATRNRNLYRITWTPGTNSWSGPVLMLATTNNIAFIRPARTWDRTLRGVALFDSTPTAAWKFLPVNDDGTPGAVETVDVSANAADDQMGLLWTGAGNPRVVQRNEDSLFTNPTGTARRKTRSGGAWPGAWTTFTVDDPPTDPDIFLVISTSNNEGLKWGGGSHASQGDVHALKSPASQAAPVFTYRRRVDGSWFEDSVNFAALDEPITGTGAAETVANKMTLLTYGTPARASGVVWMTAPGAVRPYTLWFVRRTVANG